MYLSEIHLSSIATVVTITGYFTFHPLAKFILP